MRSLFTVLVLGCSAERAQTVELPRTAESKPVATVDASLLPAPSATHAPSGNACVMLYECGCNAGCVRIDRPLASLVAGKQVGVVSGPLTGSRVFVAQSRTDQGDSVFTVQRADPNAPIQLCGTTRAPLIGYLCATANMGAARACDACE